MKNSSTWRCGSSWVPTPEPGGAISEFPERRASGSLQPTGARGCHHVFWSVAPVKSTLSPIRQGLTEALSRAHPGGVREGSTLASGFCSGLRVLLSLSHVALCASMLHPDTYGSAPLLLMDAILWKSAVLAHGFTLVERTRACWWLLSCGRDLELVGGCTLVEGSRACR